MTYLTPIVRRLPFFAVLALALTVAGAAAQEERAAASLAPTAEQATPNVVKLKFENDRVRILEATSEPGDKEQMHSHPQNVVVVLEGGKLRITTGDGKTSETEFKTGETLWREPLTHRAENIGTTRFRAIIVELKKP